MFGPTAQHSYTRIITTHRKTDVFQKNKCIFHNQRGNKYNDFIGFGSRSAQLLDSAIKITWNSILLNRISIFLSLYLISKQKVFLLVFKFIPIFIIKFDRNIWFLYIINSIHYNKDNIHFLPSLAMIIIIWFLKNVFKLSNELKERVWSEFCPLLSLLNIMAWLSNLINYLIYRSLILIFIIHIYYSGSLSISIIYTSKSNYVHFKCKLYFYRNIILLRRIWVINALNRIRQFPIT